MTEREKVKILFERNYRKLFVTAYTMLHDEEESRDVVHDVFAELMRRLPLLREDHLEAYLNSCVRNRCLNAMRNRSIHERIARLYLLEDDSTEPSESVWDDEALAMLKQAVDELQPPACRDVIRMHFDEGLKFREIASKLHVSETIVYRHLRRAMQQLRSHLKNMKP